MAGGYYAARKEKTLFDWVRDFRMKKIQMKRKARRGVTGLRVCAILATALKSAEKELRQKQHERFIRWSQMQCKLVNNQSENITPIYSSFSDSRYDYESIKKQEEEEIRKKEIAELWKNEISSLDEFMRSLSSPKSVASS